MSFIASKFCFMATSASWRKLPISLSEFCLDTTLRCGQSFRWKKSSENVWSCALHGRILSLRQDSTHLHYRAIFPTNNRQLTPPPSSPPSICDASSPDNDEDTEALIQHYLNLTPNLTDLYEEWSSADANFKKKAPKFTGIRVLKQDAWEALIGFICSSNNNIARISKMMDKLCIHYGSLIGYIDSQPYYDIPPPAALTSPCVEAHLRELGFGYRAKYLYQTALIVTREREHGWLDSLRNPERPIFGYKSTNAGEMSTVGREGYRRAHQALLTLQGVGPKVADCVCLMGLGWGEAVPVDTHVWQIAQRDYKFGKGKFRSLTKATYDAVGDHFRDLWGNEAGWAHSVLFAADLRTFSEKLHSKIEVKEEIVKEEGVEPTLDLSTKVEIVTEGHLKRELEDETSKLNEVKENIIVRRTKRRRKI